ncbi:hypothetical protein [Azospirillum sp. TSO22-1]|uniref:hypothetical protein n=1 Tax=Azospirillum sp. TSO22-1 TaxID=716789 RepID=UPI000D60F133|nr:hypothetical protein [Azospirillum sp. TSO22-1]PWC43849.1 hypothetical protein TSO221_19040 [Azospirillum sp. TSO22-1]
MPRNAVAAVCLVLLCTAPAVAEAQFVTFQDPREGAFTVQVPAGWGVSGGTVRRSAVDVVMPVAAVSPDNQIGLFLGDADVPVFSIMNDTMRMLGFREGQPYSPGYGQTLILWNYQPGHVFARNYGQRRFGASCGSALGVVDNRPRPDMTQRLNGIFQQGGMVQQTVQAGEAAFACTNQYGRWAAYVFAATMFTGTGQTGVWDAHLLYGFHAPEHRAAEAAGLLAHMVGSFTPNPQWWAAQLGTTGNVSGIVTRTGQEIAATISGSYWSGVAAQNRMSQNRSDATRGVERWTDPATGQDYELKNGPRYQWVNPRGQTFGSDHDTPPGPDWRPLARQP